MRDYPAAIGLLNSLQSNAALLEAIRKSGSTLLPAHSLPEFRAYMKRTGYKPSDFDKLNVIHVAGTKGKGSTSAMCESILRQTQIANKDGSFRPIKTGLFTSPHIQEVRERIRINGAPMSKELFAKYFFNVWDKLEENKFEQNEFNSADKPFYFRYLSLMSFHAFLEEKVDVVILEVGIGGEYDSTNVVEKPVVCGITSLGMDHVALLGDTIEKIAWHKAGIIKEGVPVVVSPQLPGAMQVIRDRAVERKASRLIEIADADIASLATVKIGLQGEHQRTNAAVARTMCQEWIKSRQASGEKFSHSLDSSDWINRGLESVRWPGRCQRLTTPAYPSIEWFIDGAHTPESLQVCATWFEQTITALPDKDAPIYIMFNCTHGREGSKLLPPIAALVGRVPRIKRIVFCTNDPFVAGATGDLVNNNVRRDTELKSQRELEAAWKTLLGTDPSKQVETSVVGSVEAAAEIINQETPGAQKRVLITGSLHLVGSFMTLVKADVV
eukprot:jgi/Hompol1/5710/HPOL_002417-RA